MLSGTNHSGAVWNTHIFTAFDDSVSSKFVGPRVKIRKIIWFNDNITFKKSISSKSWFSENGIFGKVW